MSEFAYDPTATEAKWRRKWEEAGLHTADLKKSKKPFYNMVMFPYPSGDKLHVGHWYNYAPADSYGRYMRMKGHDVFEPMGFDAFGLPAENYAIKTGVPPAESIKQNVSNMVEQLKRLGCMYDWEKTVCTTDPEYYRWTQWLFLQMQKHGLAERRLANVNWCPKDQTVLAREQCQDGKCERCGTEVIQKPLTQWFWKITDYADKLIDNLDGLDWPEKTKSMQRHWIGRSEGAEIHFAIEGYDEKITVFTTRADTLFGVTYIVLAPEHPLVEKITPKKHWGAIEAYRKEVTKKTELQRTDLNKDKTGEPTGAFALHPVTGEKLPIWVADYVLASYGTGAVMAVPVHDERDFDFAYSYELPVRCVIEPPDGHDDLDKFGGKNEDPSHRIAQAKQDVLEGKSCWEEEEGKMINSDFLNGLAVEEAKKKMIAWLEDEEKGRGVTQFRLKDWLVSRQRYWGAPIPVVYDPEGNAHPIPDKHLPWLLPTDVEFKPTGESPLRHSKEFKERTEAIFGKGWEPEYDTMDTFVCSSFYYLRYLAEGSDRHLVDPHVEKTWMPVDMYIGGPEHACMHLIYARFVMMALKDFGFVAHAEPFQRVVHQGLITNQGAKMSKSKGNVVSPDDFVNRHGADVFRMYLMFMGPFTDGGDWSDTGIKGVDRFVQKIYRILAQPLGKGEKPNKKVEQVLHAAIKRVTESVERLQFNTAISALMELLNTIEAEGGAPHDVAQTFVKLLAPLAPHLADELWETLGGKGFVVEQEWPAFDPAMLKTDFLTIAVQVNGKLRGDVTVPAEMLKEDIIAAAKSVENVQKFLGGQAIKKEIYVPGKLVSFVV